MLACVDKCVLASMLTLKFLRVLRCCEMLAGKWKNSSAQILNFEY
jgi:hypothetical protein